MTSRAPNDRGAHNASWSFGALLVSRLLVILGTRHLMIRRAHTSKEDADQPGHRLTDGTPSGQEAAESP